MPSEFPERYKKLGFSGYNQPKKSNRPEKKGMVVAKEGDKVKLIHFGDSSMGHNYSAAARKSYMARSAGIKGVDSKLSANYWSRKVLWSGPSGIKKAPPASQKRKLYE